WIRPCPWTKSSIAPQGARAPGRFRVVHPYHPLSGQEFELVSWCQAWGEDRVFFEDASGRVCSIPASWTDVAAPDPFVALAAGRSLFRFEDLRRLVALVRDLQSSPEGDGLTRACVRGIMS
ncbi:MAG: DUF5372 family protein, partial [Bacillota bacterium]